MIKHLYLHETDPRKPQHIKNVNVLHAEQMSLGDRIADQFANVIGSWHFIIGQACLLAVWFTFNSVAWFYHFDGYPFILCNLFMSAEAAFATPLVLMSQNRQATKDRITAEETYHNTVKEAEETRGIIEHLSAQDTELLKQTQLLEQHTASIEKLMRQISKATGGIV